MTYDYERVVGEFPFGQGFDNQLTLRLCDALPLQLFLEGHKFNSFQL